MNDISRRIEHLLVADARARGEGRDLDEDANEADALHALLEVGVLVAISFAIFTVSR